MLWYCSQPGLTFGAVCLLVHGVVKVTLVIALLRNKLWAYPWMIAVLLAFIAYQIYLIVLGPSPGLVALTVFDVLIVVLTWREYRKQRGIGPVLHPPGIVRSGLTEVR